ncbi:MAG TPA: hypothetical protein VMT88_09850 [Actinomycetes bacterium]|nr:hypothetical protein [Actinomycetes bacterium]
MYAFCQDMPGISVEDQETFAQLIDPAALQECIAHVVGPIDGGCRMIDVWESKSSYRRFQQQHLFPALQQWAEQQPNQSGAGKMPAFTVFDVSGAGYRVGAEA